MSRPNKHAHLDELSWEATMRGELASLDARLAVDRAPVPLVSTPPHALDLDLLAQDAIRAGHAELRRAARERDVQASAQWITPSASPSRGGPSL